MYAEQRFCLPRHVFRRRQRAADHEQSAHALQRVGAGDVAPMHQLHPAWYEAILFDPRPCRLVGDDADIGSIVHERLHQHGCV